MQRRSFIGLGMAAGLGAVTRSLAGKEVRSDDVPRRRAKQVLVILEQGGLSQMDTWDPKPETPVEQRSPFKPISTNVPGIQFTELFAKTSRHADKLAVVRSMTHSVLDHGAGTAYMLQGSKPGAPLQMPDIGSATAHIIGSECAYLPPYIMVPGTHEQNATATSGFLSTGLKVFKTGGRNLSDPKWRVADLGLIDGVDARRFRDRRDLLSNLDVGLMPSGVEDRTQTVGNFFNRAFHMLGDPRTRTAFDLTTEPESVRTAYGMGHRGQCYLLGRRLVEAGVRTVVVDVLEPETAKTPGGFLMNWDHHDEIYSTGSCGTIRNKAGGEGRYGIAHWCMMGSTDQAFAALLNDMHERGLLEDTLVCFVTEFGRTPKINKFGGRDHWGGAYSIAFAGAGVRGGQVIGRTDRDGGIILDQPFSPEDYAATLYHFLGIDPAQPVYTRENRPVFLVHDGQMISKLLS